MIIELTEKEAEGYLEKKGFEVAKRSAIKKSEELIHLKNKINFPWVMKASSNKIVHKAKMGGVLTDIDNEIKAQEAFDKLSKIPDFQECIIQETLKGEEFIIGVKKTVEFGHALMFGKGGRKVEEEKDVSFRIMPASVKDIESMTKEINFYRVIKEKQINAKIIKSTLKKIQDLIIKYPEISELDINPIFINKNQAVIADARIILEKN